MTRLSIVIPTLNEAKILPRTLKNICGTDSEIIVVDGGSTDDTVRIASELNVRVIHGPPGRAKQMNQGAALASGGTLLFLHADTQLPDSFVPTIEEILSESKVVVGAFLLKIDSIGRSFRLIEKVVNFRSRAFSLPYGDQALFIRRETFNTVNGFPDYPLMEDFEFIRKLRMIGTVRLADEFVTTSGRRWEKLGPWKTTLINQILITAYLIGVSPEKLAAIYYR